MKIVVADRIAASGVEYLQRQDDFEVVEAYGSSPEEVLQLARDASAFVVRSETRITAEVIEAAPELKVVGRAGVGVDNIDIEAASQKGVVVMNAPGGNTVATAELTFTHILCGARQIAQADASMKAGKWDRKLFGGVEVSHKTLGILGLGRIGSEIASRAQAFGMRILAHDPYLAPARAEEMGVELLDLDAVFAEADFLTVHMPLTEGTRNLIDKAAFAKMRNGVRIFNCARGGIINQEDLVEAIQSGKVAYAGLDVYEKEPLPGNSELRGMQNLGSDPPLGRFDAGSTGERGPGNCP